MRKKGMKNIDYLLTVHSHYLDCTVDECFT
jgi:hypothetical protein